MTDACPDCGAAIPLKRDEAFHVCQNCLVILTATIKPLKPYGEVACWRRVTNEELIHADSAEVCKILVAVAEVEAARARS